MDFLVQDMGDDEMTNETPHSTIVDYDEPMSSSSSGSETMSIPHTPIIRKKRTGVYLCGRSASKISNEDMTTSISISRRKGVPHRSPLC